MNENDFGAYAAEREKQILDWLEDTPDVQFTARGIATILMGESRITERVVQAYAVACEDLARRQLLKRLASVHKGELQYVKND